MRDRLPRPEQNLSENSVKKSDTPLLFSSIAMGLVAQSYSSEAKLGPGPGVPASDSLVAGLWRSWHTARGRARVTASVGGTGAGRKQGLISNPRGHGELVRLTDEGLSKSKALAVELFGT